jgi:hypothetical protein
MAMKIMSGFPLRRCSWFHAPMVPVAMTRRMIRWLDAVCLGMDRQKMARRAIRRIVAKSRSKQSNSLEATRVASKRFLVWECPT